jgi:monoterpene epsilon-lactone hydrolase
MASRQAVELNEGLRAWRASMQVSDGPISVELMRQGATAMTTFATEPAGVDVSEVDINGIPGLMHRPTGQDPRGVLLWMHGGGLVLASARTHSRMSGHLAAASGFAVLNPDYRLAPEHPFPAANEDAMAAYRWLVAGGWDPSKIVIGGDSGGGIPALATLVALAGSDEQVAAGIVISGWLDLTMSLPAFVDRVDRDLINDPPAQAQLRDLVLNGHDPADPKASPLFADLHGLPPLYVLASEEEVLYDDNAELAKRAGAAGVDVVFVALPVVPHVPTLWAGNLPEADEQVKAIGAWLRSRVASQVS